MKRIIAVLTVLAALASLCAAAAETGAFAQVTYGNLLADMLEACEHPSDEGIRRIDADVDALRDGMARPIAEHWKKVYLDPGYKLYLWGADDPAALEITGAHAFVVLGYELKDGRMTEELKGRCEAAAEAARAFPDSILVCSGGATGENNPEGHTEAGLMKDYLTVECGIDPGRVFIDERAMTTAENAVNTLAILKEQGVETMTLVTSAYHQRWGQVLYNAVAARYALERGYSVRIVGNFCYDIEPSNDFYRKDAQIAVVQLGRLLDLPQEQMDLLPDIMGGHRKRPG